MYRDDCNCALSAPKYAFSCGTKIPVEVVHFGRIHAGQLIVTDCGVRHGQRI